MNRASQPNILWFCTDQQRFDTIHALNNPHIHTSNLDRLCAEGTAFTHAHCQNPICTPSRSSFMTGMYPSSIRACTNGNEFFSNDAPLVTRLLANAGYTCGLSGKLHIASAWRGEENRVEDGYSFFKYSHSPYQGAGAGNQYIEWLEDQGLDLLTIFHEMGKERAWGLRYAPYLPSADPVLHQTTWCTDQAIEFISQNKDSDHPWEMSVNVFDPHGPNDPTGEYRKRYDSDSLPGPYFKKSDLDHENRLAGVDYPGTAKDLDVAEARDMQADYFAMVELIDHNVGRLLDFLEENDLRKKTLVIFMSDHGEMLGDHGLKGKGCRFYEGLVRVPLIFSMPGRVKEGVRADALVELIDVAPTLLDLAGAEPPRRMQGRSLLPILEGKKPADYHREMVRCEYYGTLDRANVSELRRATMVRDNRFKFVVYHGQEYGELYDLQEDPWEHHNLWGSEGHIPVRETMNRKAFDSLAYSVELGSDRIGRY